MGKAFWRPELIEQACDYVESTYQPVQKGNLGDFSTDDYDGFKEQMDIGYDQWSLIKRDIKKRFNLGAREIAAVFYFVRCHLNYFGWVYRPDIYFSLDMQVNPNRWKFQ